MPVQRLPDIANDLRRLVVDRGEMGFLSNQEPVYPGGNDMKTILQQIGQRQENLVRDPQPRNQQQGRRTFLTKNMKFHHFSK